MLRFFRTLRQRLLAENRTSRYLLYALGEIVLVVIGILIALQVNTWNEDRKNRQEGVALLKSLKSELAEDFSMMAYAIDRLERRKALADQLYQLLTHQPQSVALDSALIVEALMRSGYIHKFVPPFAAYNEIQNSGKLQLIPSDTIKKHLAHYKSRVEENLRIESPYETTLKDFEKKAVYFLAEIPGSEHRQLTERYSLINFSPAELSADQEFLSLLKQISYISAIELNLKEELLIPRLKALQDLIDKELAL